MAQSRHKTPEVLMGYVQKTKEEIKTSYDGAFSKPQPKPDNIPEPQPQVVQQPESNLKEQLTARFVRGEITEAGYLLALKNIDNNDNTGQYTL